MLVELVGLGLVHRDKDVDKDDSWDNDGDRLMKSHGVAGPGDTDRDRSDDDVL